ncbi:YncE family protein [Agrococcus beijingensis]|uniref:YncE family protein n=1 Tax=Agrococcus beijingensis TaxID=3068634 RepID=UPI002741B317|nr:hypothetical protein [Agrococcus sp. REN33]
MKTAWRSATIFLAAAALVGCTPGSLETSPSPSPSEAATARPTTETSPSPVMTPAPEAQPQPVLLATLAASDGLAIVDPDAADPVLGVIPVGQAPWGVAAQGAAAYVATAEGLAVVDLAARTRAALVPYLHQPASVGFGEYRDGGLGIAVSPDGARVYVAVHRWPDPAWLEVYDVASGAFVASADVGIRPFDVLADPGGAWVATVDHDSYTVTLIDPASPSTVVRTVEIAPFGNLGFSGWEKPHYAAITADGRIALPYQGLVTVLLDPATGATERVEATANSHQHGVATAPDGRLVTSGTGAFGTATGSTNVSLLDPLTGAEQVIPLQRPHETVAIWQGADASGGAGADAAAPSTTATATPAPAAPATAATPTAAPSTAAAAAWSIVLAGGYTRDGWWDGLTVVDPSSGSVREVALAGRPQHVIAATLPAD